MLPNGTTMSADVAGRAGHARVGVLRIREPSAIRIVPRLRVARWERQQLRGVMLMLQSASAVI